MNLPSNTGPLGVINMNVQVATSDVPRRYPDIDDSEKKRDNAAPAFCHRRSHRFFNDLPIEPTADIEAALRASKRAKK